MILALSVRCLNDSGVCQQVLQLGMGSGFKCCSAVWKALRDISIQHPCWEFRDHQPEPLGWSDHNFVKNSGDKGEVELTVEARETQVLAAPSHEAAEG